MKKVCSKCKIEKELTEFYNYKHSKDGKQQRCKDCMKEYSAKYCETNKEKLKESWKKYREANKEKKRKYDKGYYEANKEQKKEYDKEYRKANKEKLREQRKAYNQTEKGKDVSRRKDHKRRAKIKQVANLGIYTTAEWKECLKRFNYCDAYTGEPLGSDITIDHITPISKGGTNNINNLVPCKKSTNSKKHNSLLDEWYPKQPFYSKKRHKKIKEWIRIKSQINLFEL